jgi:hypothetical protein
VFANKHHSGGGGHHQQQPAAVVVRHQIQQPLVGGGITGLAAATAMNAVSALVKLHLVRY